MTSEEKKKQQIEQTKNIKKEKRVQPDPLNTHKKLFNPATGDLYITTTDKNGLIRRQSINLFGD